MRSRSRPEWVDGDEEVLPAVSTSSLAFQAVLDDLVRAVDAPELPAPTGPLAASRESMRESTTSGDYTSQLAPESALIEPRTIDEEMPPQAPVGAPPARLRGRGDLTLVVGVGDEVHDAARVLAASADAAAEVQRVADRRDALAARAAGVRREIPVVAAFPLAGPGAVPAVAIELAGIAPDQVWAAVDVSRKHEDTAEWVRALDAVLAVDALVATGASRTLTPDSVHRLGLPVLWLEAPPGG
ncbi:hypothetical protein [Leifsonia shinshuensis]|uniref:hypothetical protein n=1 Tax=Leifsonia shinshuensis TaxID=150026 RepID=UPI00285F0A32|nr:hypothetical protein [Leifsonia shinshuensis]MDR6972242.1 hypothetical protein [Leifsonia shinshuensis]